MMNELDQLDQIELQYILCEGKSTRRRIETLCTAVGAVAGVVRTAVANSGIILRPIIPVEPVDGTPPPRPSTPPDLIPMRVTLSLHCSC